jgi:SAM-dependent methyltransferase
MDKTGRINISVSKGDGPRKQSRILYEACPLCTSKKFSTFKTTSCQQHALYKPEIDPVMIWQKCAECGHVFTDGYFTPESFSIIFKGTHNNQTVGHDVERQRFVSARMVEKVLPYTPSGYWLDVGFGNASLLLTAQEYGFKGVGLDLRPENARALQDWGLEAYCGDLQALQQAGRYDVISMADVLEHFPYPVDVLKQAQRLLKDKGILLISMPNDESAVWRALDKANTNPYWGEIEHFHNFSKERLYRLLREHGFEPLRYGISERYRACMEIIARKI